MATHKKKQAVPRVTVSEAVTDRLRQRILSGELADGTPLRQGALAEEMGTSRIPVREALSRLESEGLVASFPHKGSVVTGLSKKEIVELFDLRSLLEPELIRYAIPNLTDQHLAEASAISDQLKEAYSKHDVDSLGELNRRFHLALYAAAGRPKTFEIVRSLLVHTDRYTRLLLATVGDGIVHAQEDHNGILDLCKKGLVNQAIALTRDHIQRNEGDLLKILDSEL